MGILLDAPFHREAEINEQRPLVYRPFAVIRVPHLIENVQEVGFTFRLNKRRGEVRPPHKVDRHNVLLRKRADKPVSMETAWHCLASKRLRMARAVVTAGAPSHPDRPPARAPEALTLRKSVPTIKRYDMKGKRSFGFHAERGPCRERAEVGKKKTNRIALSRSRLQIVP